MPAKRPKRDWSIEDEGDDTDEEHEP